MYAVFKSKITGYCNGTRQTHKIAVLNSQFSSKKWCPLIKIASTLIYLSSFVMKLMWNYSYLFNVFFC